MGGEFIEEADMDVLPSMWPDDIGNEARKQFNMERPGVTRDMLEDVTIKDDPSVVDFKRLLELTSYSEKGSSQLAYLVKHWEYKHNNAVRLLNEEINILSKQRQEVELKKLEILEEHRFEEDSYAGSKRSVSILEDACDIWGRVPRRRNDILAYSRKLDIDADYDTVMYWKQRAMQLDKMLEESIEREHILTQKLEENIKDLETQSSPVEELSQILKRADNFLHFILQTAPIVIGHQDKELRYRFIYNHFPRLEEEDIIGKTDEEIFCGAGVKEIQDFKREVLERGSPAKREFTFDTPLFGSKTFMIYVEPVFSKAGDRIGVNYMGMDVTDQIGKLWLSEVFVRDGVLSMVDLASKSQSKPILSVARVVNSRFSDPPGSKTSFCGSPGVLTPYKASQDMVAKREKMAKLREEIAVQKAKETELNRTIHITEETMRAKQMLATMSHEIRSPLTGVVSMAEILATTKLDREQSQLLDVMLSSGDMVLQLINDILDLAKFESGAMKLEATKFRPREVVRHVLQTAAASLKKELTLEGHVADDVPVEVIGDVLRIRQILTNLISNAIKFTHEGKVGINLHVVSEQHPGCQEQHHQGLTPVLPSTRLAKKNSSETQSNIDRETSHCSTCQDRPDQNSNGKHHLTNEDTEKHNQKYEKIVWLRCDVYDTGIGIPDKALPSLFKKYMQASADHARKYGGTGLGLAICKQLVELMGGNLTVTSKEHCGSTFTFVLPYKVPLKRECPDDRDEDAAISDSDVTTDYSIDEKNGSFIFKPRTWGTLFSSDESTVCKTKLSGSSMLDTLDSSNGLSESVSFSSSDCTSRTSVDGVSPISDATKTLTELKRPVQQSLGHNGNDFRRINRRDEGCQDSRNGFVMHKFNSSIMDSSRTHWISGLQQGKMASSKGANMAESGKCVPTCQSPRHEKEDNKSKCTSDRSSFKILLAEDNKINVMVAQSMMKQLGHRIDVVNNGLEAIRAIQRSRYDLILMDICMPVMDGMQATRLIRSFEEHGYWDASVSNGDDHAMACPDSLSHGPDAGRCRKRIPIIAMTANALAESAADCLANGMDSFVSKPVTFQNLKQCLQQYLPC